MVIYGQRVNLGVTPNTTEQPLSWYSCPSIFIIVKKKEGKDGYYVVIDTNGNYIKLHNKFSQSSYLYDAQEWLTWNAMREKANLSFKKKKNRTVGRSCWTPERYTY